MAVNTKTAPPDGQKCLAELSVKEGLLRLFALRREQLCRDYARFLQQENEEDEEALHDLRVSLRRLHSLLRNYKGAIAIDKSLTKQLHTLRQQSNAARDLEVFVAQLTRLFPQQSQLIHPLQQQRILARRQLRRDLPRLWETLLPLLQQPPAVTPGKRGEHTLGELSARLGLKQLRRMKKGLRSLHRHWDEALLHRLRIRGKQLRYLLEPFAGESELDDALNALKYFQDDLGDYRDQQLLLQHLASWQAEDESHTVTTTLIEALPAQLQQQKKRAKHYRKHRTQKNLLSALRVALRRLSRK
jgi:CHAD domain-containing protein